MFSRHDVHTQEILVVVWEVHEFFLPQDAYYMCFCSTYVINYDLVCWSLTSLCHSNGHIETMPVREINPFTALTRIRSQFLRTQ